MITDQLSVDPAYREALAERGLGNVEEILRRLGDRITAWSRSTDTVYVGRPGGKPGFYLKRYYHTTWRKQVRGFFRGTFFGQHRAAAEARTLLRMRRNGISAVRPVAWGCRRRAHFITASFLITEEAPRARNLTSFAADVGAGRIKLSFMQRRRMTLRLAEQVAHMHAAGFEHSQLFWRNVLIRILDDDEPEYLFLDARPFAALPGRKFRQGWRMGELAQLTASARPFTTRTERARFARRYFSTIRFSAWQREAIRAIEDASRDYESHEARRIIMSNRFDAWNRALANAGHDALEPAGTEDSSPRVAFPGTLGCGRGAERADPRSGP